MQTKKLVLAAIVGGVVLLGAGYFLDLRKRQETTLVDVVTTFFPLASIAQEVGGEYVEVTQIVPDGVEPHEYEPSADDVAQMLSADVVIINGGGVDAWAEKLIPDIQQEGGIVVRLSDRVPLIEGDGEADEEGEELGAFDPHAWLDLGRMQELPPAIAEALTAKDAAHAEQYARGSNAVRAKLVKLDEAFTATLKTCAADTILVTHNAFRYWALRYNFHVEGISGITPEAEPSVSDLANLIEKAKELGVTTVFFESPASNALAATLAGEIGASVDVLSSLEGRTPEEITEHATYFTIMGKNLEALSRALSCTP